MPVKRLAFLLALALLLPMNACAPRENPACASLDAIRVADLEYRELLRTFADGEDAIRVLEKRPERPEEKERQKVYQPVGVLYDGTAWDEDPRVRIPGQFYGVSPVIKEAINEHCR